MKEVVKTILSVYELNEIDLLRNKAIDLFSLMSDLQIEELIDSNENFVNLMQSDLGKDELLKMINILVEYI